MSDQEGRDILVEDVLDRYENTWPGETVARKDAERVLRENLDAFIVDARVGPTAICLGAGESFEEAKSNPLLRTPLLIACQARQRIAYSLHLLLQGVVA